jgi:hypothetical protein
MFISNIRIRSVFNLEKLFYSIYIITILKKEKERKIFRIIILHKTFIK